jgi:hypothetical protein
VNRKTLIFVFIAILTLCFASMAQAQATRTWVSGVGDDANPCSRTAPCKTFAGAISKTAIGGEISVLDPGGFGAVTITKSITINGEGTLAGILAAGTVGVIVNPSSTSVVTLRNISIVGAGTGTDGIRILNGAKVNIENCTISGFINQGIDIIPSTAGLTQQIVVSGSEIRNNTQQGIQVLPSGTAHANLVVRDTLLSGNGATAVDVAGSGNSAAVHNSTMQHNLVGAQVQLTGSELFIDGCMISNNTLSGIITGQGAGQTPTTQLTRSSVVNNAAGITGGGTTTGFTNNVVVGNNTNNTVTTSVLGQ